MTISQAMEYPHVPVLIDTIEKRELLAEATYVSQNNQPVIGRHVRSTLQAQVYQRPKLNSPIFRGEAAE